MRSINFQFSKPQRGAGGNVAVRQKATSCRKRAGIVARERDEADRHVEIKRGRGSQYRLRQTSLRVQSDCGFNPRREEMLQCLSLQCGYAQKEIGVSWTRRRRADENRDDL